MKKKTGARKRISWTGPYPEAKMRLGLFGAGQQLLTQEKRQFQQQRAGNSRPQDPRPVWVARRLKAHHVLPSASGKPFPVSWHSRPLSKSLSSVPQNANTHLGVTHELGGLIQGTPHTHQ